MSRARLFLRFVAHDLRLHARGLAAMFGGASPRRLALVLTLGGLALHAAAWPVARWLLAIEDGAAGAATIRAYLAGALMLALPWMVAQSMTALTRSLYGRSDLELLLSSPADARALFCARALAIAIDAGAAVCVLVAPLADDAALMGRPHWLALFAALATLALLGAGVGVALAMLLFRAFGARRARLFSQIAATAVGGSFVLGAQIAALLPAPMRASVAEALASLAGRAGFAVSLLSTPLRAAQGEPAAILIALGFAGLVFAAACLSLGQSFARAALVASGAPVEGAGGATRATRFAASVGAALRAKERRVVWRDPWLMSQLLLQAAYTLPVAVILWRNGGVTGSVRVAFTPALVVIAAQLAGALAWVALSAEDAPDFLATTPVARATIERGKIAAIAQPIALMLALPLLALTATSPWAGVCALAFGASAIVSASLVNLWRQTPSRRGLVLRRHSQSKLVGLMEHALSILWGVGAGIAVIGSWAAIAPLGLAGLVLALNWKWAAGRAPGPALAVSAAARGR